MKIGDRIYVRGYVDEIRKDTVIVRNDGGYFGAIPSEVITGELPSAQPDLSQEYAKAVFAWLLDYQIKAAELKGRYTPYEVLSWIANDWRKEHE